MVRQLTIGCGRGGGHAADQWFNAEQGYGFIAQDGGNKDDFVHISAVECAGLRTLQEGQKVSYDLVTGRNGKASADNLRVA